MKRLMLAAACVALIGAGSAFAQQDTTRTRTQTPTQTPTQSPTQQQPSNQMKDDMKGWSRVNSTDVPESLRTTLGDSQYAGWESGTVYRNQAGDTYSLQVNDRATNSQKTYYFDKNGKVTKRPNDRKNDN
jgi:hypothetical protein